MSASSLLAKSMGDHVNNADLGVTSILEYYFRDGTNESTVAFVDVVEKRNERTQERYDAYIFSQMALSQSPRLNGDYIVYEGETLIVTKFYKQLGFYIVECTANRAGMNRRS